MNFDGTNWVNTGNVGFSEAMVDWPRLAFNPSDGKPYVAYSDDGNYSKATVTKYDSVNVGVNDTKGSKLSFYPDPVKTNLTIDIKNLNGAISFIEIYELRGKKILETKTKIDRIILNFEHYPVGIYIVKVKTNESDFVGKFTKN